MHKYLNQFFMIMILTVSLAMTGCGGGGGGTPASYDGNTPAGSGAKVTGVAAAGAPVVGTVNIKGANGKLSFSAIGADGSFTVDVSALSKPFIVFVEGHSNGTQVKLYSTISEPGYVNVNPITTMALAKALEKNPEEVYTPADIKSDGKTIDPPPSQEKLTEAVNEIKALLKEVFDVVQPGQNFDLMNGTFTIGTGMDKVLDLVKIETTGDNVVISDKASGDVYYKEDVETGKIDPNTKPIEDLAEVVKTTSDLLTDLQELANKLADIFTNTDLDSDGVKNIAYDSEAKKWQINDPDYRATLIAKLKEIYTKDIRDEGVDNIEDYVDEMIEEDIFLFQQGILSGEYKAEVKIQSISIIEECVDNAPLSKYGLTAGAFTFKDPRSNTNPPTDVTYIIQNGTLNNKFGKNKAFKCSALFTTHVTPSGLPERIVETDRDIFYVVNDGTVDKPVWKILGDGSPVEDSNIRSSQICRDSNQFVFNENTKQWARKNVIDEINSGFKTRISDEGNMGKKLLLGDVNSADDFVIIVTGDGINATLGSNKGLLIARNDNNVSTDFRIVNVPGSNEWHQYYEKDGLNISDIKNLDYNFIAFRLNKSTGNLTPVCSWTESLDHVPLPTSQLTADMFPKITSPTDMSLNSLSPYKFPWTFNISWELPASLLQDDEGHFEINFHGRDANGNWTWTSIEPDETENWDDSARTFSYTLKNDPTNNIRQLNNVDIHLDYSDSSGREFNRVKLMELVTDYYVQGRIIFPVQATGNLIMVADTDTDPTNGYVYSNDDPVMSTHYENNMNILWGGVPLPEGNYFIYGYLETNGTPGWQAGEYRGIYQEGGENRAIPGTPDGQSGTLRDIYFQIQ